MSRKPDSPCPHLAPLMVPCSIHPDPWDCPDILFVQRPDGSIILPIRDGGRSGVVVSYCPFCGERLEDRRRK